jgi:Putative F0F1-ATPase subunit Ca2+/Mg2+ transporter
MAFVPLVGWYLSPSKLVEVIVDKQRPGILQFAGLGLLNAICLGAGLTAGWFADQALGTLPLFLFIGLILGIASGVMLTRSEIKRYS